MKTIREVLRLVCECGLSYRHVAKSLSIARFTVADYVTRFHAAGLSWPLPIDLDDCDLERRLFPPSPAALESKPVPNWTSIHQELKRKGSTLQALHEEYLAEYPHGMTYSYFCQSYRAFAKTLKRYMRQTHVVGEKVFVDYCGPTVPITDMETGCKRNAQIFVGVLGASDYIYADAIWNQQLPNWVASHVRMFEHFGGVPALVVCDNLKSAVTRASRTDPDLHPIYQDLASHYGTAILPARPYKPRDKAKAENGVLIVERWILFRLRKRQFTSLHELNAAIRELLSDVNERPFKNLPGCRRTAFETLDRPALKPLPRGAYCYAEFRKVRVGLDYHIEIDGHFYSVPYVLVRQELQVRLTVDTVEILHGGRRVASHPRSYVPRQKTTDSSHADPSHRHFSEWEPDRDMDWALGVGQNTHAFLQILLAKYTQRELAYRSIGALKTLGREFGPDRLEAACTRALAIGATETRNVRSILRTNLDRQPLSSKSTDDVVLGHENIRGPEYYR